MNPAKVRRENLRKLTDLPNIGPAMAKDLVLLGMTEPHLLTDKNPYTLYAELCDITGVRHDPCVLDTLISITRFMAGEAPQPWWAYTAERKRMMVGLV